MKTFLISAAFVAFSAPAFAASVSGDLPGDRNPHQAPVVERSASASGFQHVANDDFPGDRNPSTVIADTARDSSVMSLATVRSADEFPGDRNPHGRS